MANSSPLSGTPDVPPLSLRGGNALDDYTAPPPFDPQLDRPTPEYLDGYHCGITYLDPVSWRYYLPILIDHALRNIGTPQSMAVHSFLASLRPPDRDPPRLESLSEAEKAAVIAMLDTLAFDDTSVWKPEAMTALEEYWAPGALYRRSNEA